MSRHDLVILPDGQAITAKPVFAGWSFEPNEQNTNNLRLPSGWTVVLHTEGEGEEHRLYPFEQPTLRNDSLFISSISFSESAEFNPPTSLTRQIAMMLWTTLYWYFHQPEPSPFLATEESKNTPDEGKPKADWRINIKGDGVFRGKNMLRKLERMGLIYSEQTAVGMSDDGVEGLCEMFASRRAFWQLPAQLFLFTLSSRDKTTPVLRLSNEERNPEHSDAARPSAGILHPFGSGSHLPTYYPPPPLQYTSTNGVRHPLRPKPPRQGEVFYSRFIPSLGEHLAFRVASLSDKPVPYTGPKAPGAFAPAREDGTDTRNMPDLQLLHKWMNLPRVSKFWGCSGPIEVQEKFLRENLSSKHSFPAIGCWDGKPFGFFELYWVKEDGLGKVLNAGEAKDWDRGVHVLVGEQEFRGGHRLSRWVSSLVHWALLADYRTECLVLEPRIDNTRFHEHLANAGFTKEKQVVFPYKTSWYMRHSREAFDGPAL